MGSAASLERESSRVQGWEQRPARPEGSAWEAQSTLRLRPSDLRNPSGFYRRLEAWIMKQK